MLKKMGQKLADFFGDGTKFDRLADEKEVTSDFLEPDYLSDLLNFRLYDSERRLYENKNSFGFVLELVPTLGGSQEATRELNALIREIGEEGTNIQTLLFADPRIDRFFENWSLPRQKLGGIFSKIADKKQEFFKKNSGNTPPRIFRSFFSYSEPKPSSEKEILFLLDKLVEKKKKALETLSRISRASDMKPKELIELVSGMVNFGCSSKKTWNEHDWISKQVCLHGTGIEVSQYGLLFHGIDEKTFMRTYETIDVPKEWSLSLTGELIGDFLNPSYRIPSPFYIHYGIHFPIQKKVEIRFKSKLKVLEHQSKFPSITRMFPDMPKEIGESLFVQKGLLEGEKFVETRLSAGLWAVKEQFVKAESVLKNLLT